MTAADLALLARVWQFLDEEADNRDCAGSEMSDYAREPRELANEVSQMLDEWRRP